MVESVLLEPIMKVEVTTPDDRARFILSDLRRRRGQIEHQETRGNTVVIYSIVPMNMFGYANDLHAMANGRATFSMQFDHYAVAPLNVDGDPPFRPAVGMRA